MRALSILSMAAMWKAVARAGDGVVRYACPMHPEVTASSPGTCPKCGGMALKPVSGGGIRSASRVRGLYAPDPERRAALARSFPNPILIDQQNRRVRFYDDLIKNKVVMINFMFTSCTSLCPRATANLAKVQAELGDHLGRDVWMISFTIDPDHDTVPVLREYAERNKAKPGWSFVTGKKADIDSIRSKLGAYDEDSDKTQHTGLVICGNEAIGKWMAKYAMAQPDTLANFVMGLISPAED